MIDGDRVIHEVSYPHSIERVWHALTDSTALAQWLMPNDFELEIGHRFQLDARPTHELFDAEVIAFEAPRYLECRWTIDDVPTTVLFTLRPDETGTRLRVEHRGLADAPRREFDGGWTDKLARDLAAVLRQEEPT